MSDAIVLPENGAAEARRTPTVYFIDDSATMREVIKIAFRRENINVITCADAASALAQFEQNCPINSCGVNGLRIRSSAFTETPFVAKLLFRTAAHHTTRVLVKFGCCLISLETE